jgi:hypothetical protein
LRKCISTKLSQSLASMESKCMHWVVRSRSRSTTNCLWDHGAATRTPDTQVLDLTTPFGHLSWRRHLLSSMVTMREP